MNEHLDQEILALIDQAYDAYTPESIEKSIALLMKALDLVEERKTAGSEEHRVLHDLMETYIAFGDLESAIKWVDRYLAADKQWGNYGKGQLDVGELYYKLKRFDEAKDYFKQADEISNGRIWRDRKDTELYQFYKKD